MVTLESTRTYFYTPKSNSKVRSGINIFSKKRAAIFFLEISNINFKISADYAAHVSLSSFFFCQRTNSQ